MPFRRGSSVQASLPPSLLDKERDWAYPLSYDIVKVHGGEIKVETREGEGSEFIIQLPIAGIR